ncbi:MAG TPA: tetratricopeptide repeat protein, partial [Afipia sp.]
MSVSVARAQEASEQQQLFQQMVRNPANHEVTFAFVKVATERGDYEAAIGALERLLFYNSKLTRVKYELGALYFRLGSYEMAKRYFNEALASPDIDAVTKQRIETYLPDTEKQLQQSRFSGFMQTGIRSQSNASFAPAGNILRLGGN